jgi:hypothetical protein
MKLSKREPRKSVAGDTFAQACSPPFPHIQGPHPLRWIDIFLVVAHGCGHIENKRWRRLKTFRTPADISTASRSGVLTEIPASVSPAKRYRIIPL